MTWRPALEVSKTPPREVIEVVCDAPDCHAWEVVGLHGGDVVKVQKLLLKRGWSYTDVVEGAKDLCPAHPLAVAS